MRRSAEPGEPGIQGFVPSTRFTGIELSSSELLDYDCPGVKEAGGGRRSRDSKIMVIHYGSSQHPAHGLLITLKLQTGRTIGKHYLEQVYIYPGVNTNQMQY
jgi:hypothetical protein